MNAGVKKRTVNAVMSLLALAAGLLVIFPLVYGVMGAFKSEAEFSAYPPTLLPRSFSYTKNFEAVWAMVPVLRFFLNSLIVAVLGTTVRLSFAVLAAYAFVFFEFKGKKALFIFILATMMLPADTMIVTNYQTVARLGLLDNYLGMAIVSFVGASQMFMLRQHFLSSPRSLRDAAQMDGCGDIRFLVSILLPVSRPLLVMLYVQGFVALWNTYLWPLLVTNHNDMRTIQVGITMLTTVEGTNYHQVLAGVAISLVPAFLLFLLLRKSITRGMVSDAEG
ncbi:MAG: carbohydrate ABC transporter permease [Clostridia bacterium]|nr:carbohydrate ABC transporter permease [Clostridia bacterium]